MVRKGKIARLPREVRNELNRRLAASVSGGVLLRWLNDLSVVREVLARDFGGSAISKQNLHEWRIGGFAEWQARQALLEQAREFTAEAQELNAAAEGQLTDHLATVLAARYAAVLAHWDGTADEAFRQEMKFLRGLCRDIVELRRGDHARARRQMEARRKRGVRVSAPTCQPCRAPEAKESRVAERRTGDGLPSETPEKAGVGASDPEADKEAVKAGQGRSNQFEDSLPELVAGGRQWANSG